MADREYRIGRGLAVDKFGGKPHGFGDASPVENLRQFRPKKTRTITLDLTTARTNQELQISGNTLWCPHCSDASATLFIQIGEDSDPIPFKSGTFMLGFPFARILLTNTAQAGVSFYLTYFTAFIDESAKVF